MCDGPMPGFLSRQMIYAKGRALNRKDARLAEQQQVVQPRASLTEKMQTGLVVCVCIVVLASASTIIHALAVGLAVVAVIAAALWWRGSARRRRERAASAPAAVGQARIVVGLDADGQPVRVLLPADGQAARIVSGSTLPEAVPLAAPLRRRTIR